MARVLDAAAPDFADAYRALIRARGARLEEAEEAVRPVLSAVRERGVEAVLAYTAKFDGLVLKPEDLRVSAAELNAARAACADDLLAALEMAAQRIADFHAREAPQGWRHEDGRGVRVGARWTPVDSAGVYAPGGLAAYPSSVLMNVIPAKAAGAARIALCTPPGKLLENPAILAAAQIAGVDEVWRVGGAQAIAAMAYGAGPLAACDVIAGPGNAYVTAAKKLVYGEVGVDSIAGPSEVFILAEGEIDPRWIAADLLAQAEHDEDAQSILFCSDRGLAEAAAQAVEAQLAAGKAGANARVSWERHGAIVLVGDLADATALCDLAAPEHLEIMSPRAEALAAAVRHAGAIFIGAYAPEALGDYIAGPSHVLPTARSARFASGVSVYTFMKRTSLIEAGPEGLAALGPMAARIADAEGLPAHAWSLRVRTET